MKAPLLLLAVLLALPVSALAQTYRIDWYSISSGGATELTSGSYKLGCTIGRPAAGYVEDSGLKHWIGFWVGEPSEPPTVVERISEAKLLPDDTLVSVSGKIATSASPGFATFFYLEEEDRYSGIRVAASPGSVSGLAVGSVVNVIGRLGTTPAGERQIAGPSVVIAGTHAPLAPVGMPNRTVGGGDFGLVPLGQSGVTGGFGTNNVGVLIQTWGRVIEVGSGYALVDDGSGSPVRIDTSVLASPPAQDSYISVIGISSLHKPGADRLRLVLPRTDNDLTGY